jgi:hypothetical protein
MSRTIDPNKTIIQDCSGNKVSLTPEGALPTKEVDPRRIIRDQFNNEAYIQTTTNALQTFEMDPRRIIRDYAGNEVEVTNDATPKSLYTRETDPRRIIMDSTENEAVVLDHNALSVALVDQTTRAFSTRINLPIYLGNPGIFYLSQTTIVNGIIVKVYLDPSLSPPTPGTGLAIYEPVITPPQLYFGRVINTFNIPGTNLYDIEVDTRIPYPFPAGSPYLFTYITNMNLNGALATIYFKLPNIFQVPINVTRIIPHMTDKEAMDDDKFGGLPALTRGVTLRKALNDGTYINYWNVHNNGEFRELSYDVTYVPASPAGNVGFGCRITYAGQHKHGVAIEMLPGEVMEMVIQDDLTGLESFTCMFEGHANGEG